MKRSNVWIFLFSLCPGAGQMYQGYMKRGLSLILMFVLPIMVGAGILPILMPLSAVVYMYSFFDSLNLKNRNRDRAEGMAAFAPDDDYLIHLDLVDGDLRRLLHIRGNLLGWGFIALGAVSLYKTILEPMLLQLVELLPENQIRWSLYNLIYSIPGAVVGVLFVLVGLWLIRSGKKEENEFEEYKGE